LTEKVLVTGGAGFIGSHLVDELINTGHSVRVIDNLEPQVHGGLRENGNKPIYLNPEAEFILGDIRDTDLLTQALEEIDVVFHEAALVGVGQSMYDIERYTDGNALGTAILLQTIIDAEERPRKIIVASSMSIYGEGAYHCPDHGLVFPKLRENTQLINRDWELFCPINRCKQKVNPRPTPEDKPLFPTSIYAVNKRDHEEMFLAVGRAYNIPAVALRYFNVYGTRQALSNPYTGVAAIFSGRLLNNKPPVIFEDGLQSRDFTHVSDIVQANMIVKDTDKANYGVYNVGTGRSLNILDIAKALIDHFEHIAPQTLSKTAKSPEIVGKFRAGDIRHCYADISQIQALGYEPKVRFEDGIAELVDWVHSQTAEDAFDHAQSELIERGLAI
jgi:dTDP-L-rhamnose 4-epimerase